MRVLGLRPVVPSLDRELYLLAGASNMAGRGVLGELASYTFAHRNRVKTYKNSGVWAPAVEPVDDATGQIDSVSSDAGSEGTSPGLSFGSTLAGLRRGRHIGLVPCARGGSTMTAWTFTSLARSTLFGSMIARAKEARATSASIKGVIFYGGGNDTTSEAAVLAFPGKFYQFIDDVREHLDAPDLKFVLSVLGPYDSDPSGWEALMRTTQAAMEYDGLSVISAADLSTKPGDTPHLDTAGLVTIGQRYAAAMQDLLG